MRPAIGLGYLLARISDTLADTAPAPLELRVTLLETFRDFVLHRETPDASFFAAIRADFLPHQTHDGERELLSEPSLTEAFAALEELSESERDAVHEVLREIIAGQRWDLAFFEENDAVSDPDLLDRYTYQVAGCVGEFWTRIGEISLGEKFADQADIGKLMRLGKHYGQGLQLVNILRDVSEDRANGRDYLPGSTEHWIARCRAHLDDAERYVKQIRGFRVRFATALPYLIARETVDLLQASAPASEKVKVSRKVVRRCLFRSAKIALRNPR